MSGWLEIARHGDSEQEIREALLLEFDQRWVGGIAQSIRRQLTEQGASLVEALSVAEQLRKILRAETSQVMVANVMDSIAASAGPRH
jgi:hypothetical protein